MSYKLKTQIANFLFLFTDILTNIFNLRDLEPIYESCLGVYRIYQVNEHCQAIFVFGEGQRGLDQLYILTS